MKKAVVIEDDKISQKYIQRALGGVVDVHVASDGASGMALIAKEHPQLIVLDIELPDTNGYDLCEKLRQDPEYTYTPILFISGRTNIEERIKGYNVGGDDYIPKPFESDELVAKIKAMLRHHEYKQNLENQFQQAQSTAFDSMTGASELGLIVQFIEKTYGINNYDELAQSMFELLGRFGLNACLIFNSQGKTYFFSSEGDFKPIEQEIMERLREQGRFYDFDQRTQINYPVVSCLIKNMPIDNEISYGRYKDAIPPILACANQKVLQLEMELLLQEHTMTFSQSFDDIHKSLDDLAERMKAGQEDGARLLQDLLLNLDEALPTLGLDQDQESYLINSIEGKVNDALSKTQSYEIIQETFNGLIRLLSHLVNEQELLVDKLVSKDNLIMDDGPGVKESSGDVDLF